VKLFSAPGSPPSDKRAWLMTPPFDRSLAAPAVVTPTRTGTLTWGTDTDRVTWRDGSSGGSGRLTWTPAGGALTWG
jgi:hypothetical protein